MMKNLVNLIANMVSCNKLKIRHIKRNKPKLDIKNKRCLMICPHPDDELIGAGGGNVKIPK